MKIKKQIIVAVGMSGGVDSTMAAYLLKSQGYKVIGLTMQTCANKNPKKDQEIEKIAQKLKIEHHFINVYDQFKKEVLDYFRDEYTNGHTPNPCIICNQKIKFGFLLKAAKKAGIKFDYFATGHYVHSAFDKNSRRYILKKGIDKAKDQSYFLWRLNQNQLKSIIFPLGNYKKTETKKLSQKVGFSELLKKRESQDFSACRGNEPIFDKSDQKPGHIINENNKIVSNHQGIINYTIGQRKGITSGGTKEPQYVLKINVNKNEITIGGKKSLYFKEIIAKNSNWVSIKKPKNKIEAKAKVRFRGDEIACTIFPLASNKLKIEFKKPQFAPTPGQSIVFYKKDILFGGAIIEKAITNF